LLIIIEAFNFSLDCDDILIYIYILNSQKNYILLIKNYINKIY